MNKIAILLTFFALLLFTKCGIVKPGAATTEKTPLQADYTSTLQIIDHDCYIVAYDSAKRHAAYVSYTLKASDLSGTAKRKNNFKPDPQVNPKQSADNDDYYKSGFDRGHLCPAADMVVSQICMDRSFYYSNISPQLAGFNRGIWKRLESQVREWCYAADSLKIYVGPIFSQADTTLGAHNITIPQSYFKTILRYDQQGTSMIGFIMKNESSSQALNSFSRTIDQIEEKIDLDLYPFLDAIEETSLENTLDNARWY